MGSIELVGELAPGFDNDSAALVITFFLALYSVGRHTAGTERWVGAGLVLLSAILFAVGEPNAPDTGDIAFAAVFLGAPWLAGLTLRVRHDREHTWRARNEALRAEQEEREKRAVAAERSRIARELHDVVSHAIAVTVLQARGARKMLGTDEQSVRRALDAIDQTNTQALSDMRRLLALLRDTEDNPVAAPQPTLDELPGLVDQVRDSGLPVELRVEGSPDDVPPGVELSAYRIVQEALTNVIKHAGPGASAAVDLRFGEEALELSVTDDGRGSAGGINGHGGGHGLVGHPRAGRGGRRPRGDPPRPRRRLRCRGAAPLRGRGMNAQAPVRVLLADDQQLVRTGLRMILSAEPGIEVVGEAANGAEAVERCQELAPDVVLMDVRMPVMDGVEATRRLQEMGEPPKVIVVTTFDLDEVVYEALRAGASGFLLKDAPETRLVAAIRVVADGGSMFAAAATRRLVQEFARQQPQVATAALDRLTERETEVLRLVARGMSNAEIAAHLVVTENTVKTHVARMLAKLGVRDRVQAVVMAYEAGLVRPATS